ncbi:MAG: twin-arginine translocase TatA/TatE family subunit [Polyangiaceae bacterium]|jgi:sec-independent protein translocase protein TatA|nr:twin-arginine translocase TatA/TatE family subunit [Polyangiaceae bacterium]
MGNIGPGQLVLIALIILLIFGAGRIAEIGKGLGVGIKNFKKGLRDDDANSNEKQLTEHKKKSDSPQDD